MNYGRHLIEPDDIEAVVQALQSEFLTTGPRIAAFEEAFAERLDVAHAVAVSSGTAALHAACHAIGVKEGAEVIVPALTFAATANAVVYCGGTPVFADVDPDTLLIDPEDVLRRYTDKTVAVIPVDYAGQPVDTSQLAWLPWVISDACHSLGAQNYAAHVGQMADLTAFSLHPVKSITAGEGGMVVTDDEELAEKMRRFRNHGRDGMDQVELGFNYRLTDFQAALGISQLRKLDRFVERRTEIAGMYDLAFQDVGEVMTLTVRPHVRSAWHLYPIRVKNRDEVRKRLAERGINCQVHYRPVHLHSYYRRNFGTREGVCPVGEEAAQQLLSLPLYPGLSDGDVRRVIGEVKRAVRAPGPRR